MAVRSRLTLLGCFVCSLWCRCLGENLEGFAACDSEIYCKGPLLKAAQTARVFNDSKTFVDLHLKDAPEDVLAAFGNVTNTSDTEAMRNFVEENFDGPGTEFIDWNPTDWKPSPSILDGIKDPNLRKWASDLNKLWKRLGRRIKDDVKNSSDRYSLMYVDKPFIVPGGRFREFYYWDSYWIIKGLLLSGMTDTVKGMLSNFVSMVDRLGFVPNGNRVYYSRRSQPPFLIPSVNDYLQATGNFSFVRSILPSLQREYEFWMTNRTVEVTKPGVGRTHTLNQFAVNMGRPRPESYREDVETVAGLQEDKAIEVYSNLASAAESGWDFSSRWFGAEGTLRSIRTKNIVPVDLNAILCLNERLLADFCERTGDNVKAAEYRTAYQSRRVAIRDIFWSQSSGVWLDYDQETSANTNKFYLSNIVPMWAGCYGGDDGTGDEDTEMAVVNYLKKEGVLNYPGGVPTSKEETGQQWDYPNAWPPLQHMLIEALANSSLKEARQLAFDLAQKWTLTNFRAYEEKEVMYEKYDVTNQGVPGHGGEYGVQDGFGWTNGVMLALLDKYGEKLRSDVLTTVSPNPMTASPNPMTTPSSDAVKPRPLLGTAAATMSILLLSR